MVDVADPLATMERAEDLFLACGVAFDPHVLAVHRLHILRRFGRTLARRAEGHSGVALGRVVDRLAVAETLAEALAEAYAHFAAGGEPDVLLGRPKGENLVQIRRQSGGSRSRV